MSSSVAAKTRCSNSSHGTNCPMEVSSLAFSPIDSNHLFVTTSSCHLHEYDLWYYTHNNILVVRDPPIQHYTNIFVSSEEINQVAVTTTTSTSARNDACTWIATADDHGDVNTISTYCANPTATNSIDNTSQAAYPDNIYIVFHHQEPPNIAMVTSVAFQRAQQSPLLASTGTDSTIKLWEVTNQMLLSKYYIPSLYSQQQQQIYNPPFVHSISWSATGNLLASEGIVHALFIV